MFRHDRFHFRSKRLAEASWRTSGLREWSRGNKNPFIRSAAMKGFMDLGGLRTPDLFNAIEALSQLSYSPVYESAF